MKLAILLGSLAHLLRSPDGAEGMVETPAGSPSGQGDSGFSLGVLDQDLTNVDTTFPLLKEGIYNLEVVSLAAVDNKDKTAKNIEIKLKTTAPCNDTKGNEIQPGFGIFYRIPLGQTEKYSIDDIKKKLAIFRLAALGTKEGAFGDFAQYVNKIVQVKLVITVDKEGKYADKNEIKSFVLPDDK